MNWWMHAQYPGRWQASSEQRESHLNVLKVCGIKIRGSRFPLLHFIFKWHFSVCQCHCLSLCVLRISVSNVPLNRVDQMVKSRKWNQLNVRASPSFKLVHYLFWRNSFHFRQFLRVLHHFEWGKRPPCLLLDTQIPYFTFHSLIKYRSRYLYFPFYKWNKTRNAHKLLQ